MVIGKLGKKYNIYLAKVNWLLLAIYNVFNNIQVFIILLWWVAIIKENIYIFIINKWINNVGVKEVYNNYIIIINQSHKFSLKQ